MSIPSFLLPAPSMRILGCDPGPTQSAYCVWDAQGRRVLNCAVLPNAELMQMIKEGQFNDCTHAAVEGMTSYGSIGKDILNTAKQVGRLLERLESRLPTIEVLRPEILGWLCGRRQAKQPEARQRLIEVYGEVGTSKNRGPLYGVSSHAWSALAVCVYGQAIIEGKDKL